ncbi:oxidative stress-induced growth inhibitor 2-like isoform X2 [Sitophilus oryzae]|uniref:Oxidative stress-induced growth inhibitor 2-like isoform X1 n=1 Tax=Sitophilus oryzae TaxID=7048 RepID=A0A6J2YTE2_SITOR|nr:oxidative stress-induced growth inhibitor 2-like isoform X1 [Sitophilus oryzae]XP_030766570.1 oxidative stress-induced growth inhibitor 2-like isoform X2 [Sitophilus oryzae]
MRTVQNQSDNTIYKDVIVIGNGPSGIAMSLILSGKLPYLTTDEHPDEMLSARLKNVTSSCLISQDLGLLAQGLEGRSSNPVSLLMDALLHPYADLGLEMEPLLEFRQMGKEIDHLVLGRGPPGGSWHTMDPDILTLSLGSWMALPGIPFPSCITNEKRAFARDVAAYYERYVDEMDLNRYFKTNTVVTGVRSLISTKPSNAPTSSAFWNLVDRVKVHIEPETSMATSPCFLTNALNCLLVRSSNRRNRLCRRSKNMHQDASLRKLNNKPETVIIPKHEKKRSRSCCCYQSETGPISRSPDSFAPQNVPLYNKFNSCDSPREPRWIVKSLDVETGETTTYSCKYVVLACGANDSPNRLEIFKGRTDPECLVHDLRSLESKLDEALKATNILDPVLIVGAGLSAADAVMAVRQRNVPVVHVFRGKSAEFNKQLPENMYPEYHKVHQMMNDGGSTYPLYQAFPEHSLTDFEPGSNTVKLLSKTGQEVKLNISFAAVLIGSKPNLSFMQPEDLKLGIFKDRDIDSKTNPININLLTYEVAGHEGLFAIGPLVGDNFVRFLTGGAVAVGSELYKKMNLI